MIYNLRRLLCLLCGEHSKYGPREGTLKEIKRLSHQPRRERKVTGVVVVEVTTPSKGIADGTHQCVAWGEGVMYDNQVLAGIRE